VCCLELFVGGQNGLPPATLCELVLHLFAFSTVNTQYNNVLHIGIQTYTRTTFFILDPSRDARICTFILQIDATTQIFFYSQLKFFLESRNM